MTRYILLFHLFILLPFSAGAQSDKNHQTMLDSLKHLDEIPKMLDDRLIENYYKTRYDTNYVDRPHQKWLFRLLLNHTTHNIRANGTVNNILTDYDLHTKGNTTISLEVNYCDVSVSLSVNPSKLSGSHDDYEFNFEYHGRRFSFDLNYLRSTTLAGDLTVGDANYLGDDGLRMNIFNLTGYYIFNHRQFSFPAALYQNYYQRCSAGSFLVGIDFQAGGVTTTDRLKQRNPQIPDLKLRFANFGIGGGYGYNWVFGRRSQWLLHLSMMPVIAVFKHNKLSMNDKDVRDRSACIDMMFNARTSLVYHFTPRYLAGTSLMLNHSSFDNGEINIKQNKLFARAFFGVRL